MITITMTMTMMKMMIEPDVALFIAEDPVWLHSNLETLVEPDTDDDEDDDDDDDYGEGEYDGGHLSFKSTCGTVVS